MAEYIYIQNYSNKGKLAISHTVFEQIVEIVTSKVQGVQLKNSKKRFSMHKHVDCEIKNGKVTTFINIKIKKNSNEEKIKSMIISEVEGALSSMTEMIPFTTVVNVKGIDDTL